MIFALFTMRCWYLISLVILVVQFLKSAHLRLRLGYTLDKVFDAETILADFARGHLSFKFDASRSARDILRFVYFARFSLNAIRLLVW